MPISLSDSKAAKIGAYIDVLHLNPNAPNLSIATDFLSYVSMFPEIWQSDLAFILAPQMHDADGIRDDIVAFYLEHMDDLSFTIYPLHGTAMSNEIANIPGKLHLDPAEFSQTEIIQTIIVELANIARIGWQ